MEPDPKAAKTTPSKVLEATLRKSVFLTDPAASRTCAPGGPAFFAYSANYLVAVQAGIVVDVEATAADRTQELDAAKKMVERVEERFEVTPIHLLETPSHSTPSAQTGKNFSSKHSFSTE